MSLEFYAKNNSFWINLIRMVAKIEADHAYLLTIEQLVQRLIIPVLVQSLKSSNIELG